MEKIHTPAKTATKILYEHSIDIMKMDDEFNSQLLHAMERYAEQYAKEQNAELLEALIQIKSLCGKTYPTNEAIFEITNNAIKKATE